MTGEYSTAEFRARFADQARDAAARADAIIAVSAFTGSQGQACCSTWIRHRSPSVVHHGTRNLAFPPGVRREKVILNVGADSRTCKNIARLVDDL